MAENFMLTALLVMTGIAVALGAVLGFAARQFKVEGNPLIAKIDAILPQTQCGQCTFPGCKPYATAIAEGRADINQCPPGGEEGIRKLADLLGVDFKPFGEGAAPAVKSVAFIDESTCIGCTLCIQACPVDAILFPIELLDETALFQLFDKARIDKFFRLVIPNVGAGLRYVFEARRHAFHIGIRGRKKSFGK